MAGKTRARCAVRKTRRCVFVFVIVGKWSSRRGAHPDRGLRTAACFYCTTGKQKVVHSPGIAPGFAGYRPAVLLLNYEWKNQKPARLPVLSHPRKFGQVVRIRTGVLALTTRCSGCLSYAPGKPATARRETMDMVSAFASSVATDGGNWTRRRDSNPQLTDLQSAPVEPLRHVVIGKIALRLRSLGAGRLLRRPPSVTAGREAPADNLTSSAAQIRKLEKWPRAAGVAVSHREGCAPRGVVDSDYHKKEHTPSPLSATRGSAWFGRPRDFVRALADCLWAQR